jgi:asparaginyl-tRNA synthetase
MKRTKIKVLLTSFEIGTEVLVKGWVRTKRGNKSIIFIALNDGSTINNIQVVADATLFDENILKDITTGACLSVTGKIVESQGQGQNIEVNVMLKHILFKRKGIRWSSSGRLPISVSGRIHSERFSE